jgi:hypothetical protein
VHLTFGMGLFWIIIASTVSETIVRAAKAMRSSRTAALEGRLEALERRLEQQARVIDAHEEAVGRLEAHADLTARLIAERAALHAPQVPPASNVPGLPR